MLQTVYIAEAFSHSNVVR